MSPAPFSANCFLTQSIQTLERYVPLNSATLCVPLRARATCAWKVSWHEFGAWREIAFSLKTLLIDSGTTASGVQSLSSMSPQKHTDVLAVLTWQSVQSTRCTTWEQVKVCSHGWNGYRCVLPNKKSQYFASKPGPVNISFGQPLLLILSCLHPCRSLSNTAEENQWARVIGKYGSLQMTYVRMSRCLNGDLSDHSVYGFHHRVLQKKNILHLGCICELMVWQQPNWQRKGSVFAESRRKINLARQMECSWILGFWAQTECL